MTAVTFVLGFGCTNLVYWQVENPFSCLYVILA